MVEKPGNELSEELLSSFNPPAAEKRRAAIEERSRQQRDGLVIITGGQTAVSTVNMLLKAGLVLQDVTGLTDGTGRIMFLLSANEQS